MRTRGLVIALVTGALTLIGANGAFAKAPDRAQKGIAPACALPQGTAPGYYAPPQECTDGAIS
jgi:hypothetical protein